MGLFYKTLCRKIFQISVLRQSKGLSFPNEKFSTNPRFKVKPPLRFIAACVPLAGAGYCYYLVKEKELQTQFKVVSSLEESTIPHMLLDSRPKVQVARRVEGSRKDLNLHLILFQYPTCPFCCKVRAFLDYYGLPYEVVEVNPVLKNQTSWTKYKKVPILLAEVEGGYQQLNDSTMIISALKTFLMKENGNLKEIANFYPMIEMKDEKGKVKTDIVNKYFLMYEEKLPKSKATEVVKEEKKWREWADNSLVHTLSPNVYRTLDEALQAFKWFSEVGEWDRLFSWFERAIIVYVGAFAMWIISKNLKKRHRILDDEREALYQECRSWMKQLSRKKTTFMGGNSPNLADLAVYGVLSSIEGCIAFNDLLQNTNIGDWYYPMKEAVNNHAGKNEIIV